MLVATCKICGDTKVDMTKMHKCLPIIEKESKALDVQVGGNHYKNMAIQPVEFTMKNNLNFCQGSVVKYISRYKFKNGLEDLKKAKHFIDLLIEIEYGEK
jgi:hypothetical protein